ncbi:MAG: nucleotidyltransferase family protein [Elusimicrobia bacterium]|nr:nucleotidyltransferase family protein [Elusimicrobiota bacterium]
MDATDRRCRKSPDFVGRRIADEFILVPIRRKVGDLQSIYTLNETGGRVWELIDGKRTVGEIRAALLDEFDAQPAQVEEDLADILGRFEAIGALCGERRTAGACEDCGPRAAALSGEGDRPELPNCVGSRRIEPSIRRRFNTSKPAMFGKFVRTKPTDSGCLVRPDLRPPPAARKSLAAAFHASAVDGARLCHWAEAAALALARRGFRVAAVKGVAAVGTCYRGEAGLRPMADADILSEDRAQDCARELLAPLGLAPAGGRQEVYTCPGGGLLEIHYQGDYPFWDTGALLRRAVPCGKSYLVPAPEEMLIFSGLHAVLHKMELRPISLADAAAVTLDKDRPLDWDKLLELMKGHPASPGLARYLRAAKDLCGAEVPERVLKGLSGDGRALGSAVPGARRCSFRGGNGWRARAIDWLLAHPAHPWFEPIATHFLGRHPAVPLKGLWEILWPTGPRLRRRVEPGHGGLLWRLGRPFYLAWRVLGLAGFILRQCLGDIFPQASIEKPRHLC